MKLLRKTLITCVLVAGLASGWILGIWQPVSQTYAFWHHGTEKYAYVLAFDHTSTLVKGGIVFHYVLNVDGHRVVMGFLHQLETGRNVPAIVLSGSPSEDDVVLASKSDGVITLFAAVAGGKLLAAVLVFLMVPVMAVATYTLPSLLMKIWKE